MDNAGDKTLTSNFLIEQYGEEKVSFAYASYKAHIFFISDTDTTISRRIIRYIKKQLNELNSLISIYQYLKDDKVNEIVTAYKMAQEICDRYDWESSHTFQKTELAHDEQLFQSKLMSFEDFEKRLFGDCVNKELIRAKGSYYLSYLAYSGVLQPNICWEFRKGGELMVCNQLHKQVNLFFSTNELSLIIDKFIAIDS